MSDREMADDYSGFIAQLSPSWRVVRCRDGIQWVLQHRRAPRKTYKDDWEGNSYCRSREGLIAVIGRAGKVPDPDPAAMAIIKALPDWIEPGPEKRG